MAKLIAGGAQVGHGVDATRLAESLSAAVGLTPPAAGYAAVVFMFPLVPALRSAADFEQVEGARRGGRFPSTRSLSLSLSL
eukprot:SAG22_NODE_2653_length_2336_cov_2.233110_3_plen_80_part_01